MSNENQKHEANSVIRTAVAEKLAEIGKQSVRDAVIQKLVGDEVANRTAAVLEGMNRLSKLKGDQRKLKPDLKSLDEHGNVVSENYSPAKYEELKKSREQIEKLEKALQLALENDDYSKLKDQKGGE